LQGDDLMFFRSVFNNIKRYSFLVKQLVIRDFKVKYKRSVLGILWSILYPLLTMAIMALVFSQMFKFNVEGVNYLVYLLTGLVFFNYFNEASNGAMTSVVANFSLINKVYIPKYIFPISRVLFVGNKFFINANTSFDYYIIHWPRK
jgi:ABC-type polysaccharide/polyol phosphate export permease